MQDVNLYPVMFAIRTGRYPLGMLNAYIRYRRAFKRGNRCAMVQWYVHR